MAKKPQGFGFLKQHDPDKLKEIAQTGGKAAQDKGTGHRWSKKEAQAQSEAGVKARWRKQQQKGND